MSCLESRNSPDKGSFFLADRAPLSKSLLLVPSALSLLLALLLPHCQKFFVYDLQAVKNDFQVSSASSTCLCSLYSRLPSFSGQIVIL